MNHYKTQSPWKFLLSASRNSLQSYELSRLSHAANLRKEIGALLDLWMEENSAAMLARWLMEQGERPHQALEDARADESLRKTGHAVSDNVFADRTVAPSANRGPALGEEFFLFVNSEFDASYAAREAAVARARSHARGHTP